MTPQGRHTISTATFVLGVCAFFGGIYAYGSAREASLAEIRTALQANHDALMLERSDRIAADLSMKQDLETIKSTQFEIIKTIRRGR